MSTCEQRHYTNFQDFWGGGGGGGGGGGIEAGGGGGEFQGSPPPLYETLRYIARQFTP